MPNITTNHVIPDTNFTRVNIIEAVFERSLVNARVERGSTFTCTRDLPIYVAAYARKNYATVEIHP